MLTIFLILFIFSCMTASLVSNIINIYRFFIEDREDNKETECTCKKKKLVE